MQLNLDLTLFRYLPKRTDVIVNVAIYSYVCGIDILKIDEGVFGYWSILCKFVKYLPRLQQIRLRFGVQLNNVYWSRQIKVLSRVVL